MFKDLLKRIYLRIRSSVLSLFYPLRKVVMPEKEELRNILFLRFDRIGDMVLSTPAIRALKEGVPGAKVSVLASSLNKEILLGNPFVDDIMVYANGLFKTIKMIRDLRKRSFDLVIDPFLTYELWTAFLSRTGPSLTKGIIISHIAARFTGQVSLNFQP